MTSWQDGERPDRPEPGSCAGSPGRTRKPPPGASSSAASESAPSPGRRRGAAHARPPARDCRLPPAPPDREPRRRRGRVAGQSRVVAASGDGTRAVHQRPLPVSEDRLWPPHDRPAASLSCICPCAGCGLCALAHRHSGGWRWHCASMPGRGCPRPFCGSGRGRGLPASDHRPFDQPPAGRNPVVMERREIKAAILAIGQPFGGAAAHGR